MTPLFPAETPTQLSPTPQQVAQSPYPAPLEKPTQTVPAALSPTVTETPVSQAVFATATQPAPTATQNGSNPYPPPEGASQPSQTPSGSEPYPLPQETPYPGPGQATESQPTSTSPIEPNTPTATQGSGAGIETTPSAVSITPTGSATAMTPTPTEFLPAPRSTGIPRPEGTITIWHSWDESQVNILMQIIQAYQVVYPDVRFDLLYVPPDDLLAKYEAASYNGAGPSLLFGPAEWGAYLYDRSLVENLGPYASDRFLATINPAALGTGQYQGALISLPVTMRGEVLYRNKKLVPSASSTFAELVTSAQSVHQNGTVGAYLDQGVLFSLAHLAGLGGQILDEKRQPVFNQLGYQKSLEWLKLLDEFRQAGPVELNGNRHMQLFKEGRVGLMVEGTWSHGDLAQAIGADNLAIDPWPSYGSGHLSGFVWADSLYMNANAVEVSPVDHLAGLRFMGYLMTSQVQAFLGEIGFIPTVQSARPGQEWVSQAMQAMAGGAAFPPALQGEVRTAYLDIFQSALYNVFTLNKDPLLSLQSAYQSIQARLAEIQP